MSAEKLNGMPAPVVYRCPNCRSWLGAMDERTLVVGAMRFYESVRAVCSHCGYGIRWHAAQRPAVEQKPLTAP